MKNFFFSENFSFYIVFEVNFFDRVHFEAGKSFCMTRKLLQYVHQRTLKKAGLELCNWLVENENSSRKTAVAMWWGEKSGKKGRHTWVFFSLSLSLTSFLLLFINYSWPIEIVHWLCELLLRILYAFVKKVRFNFFIKLFLHTFCQKPTFCYPTAFFESLITQKRSIFEESYISCGKRQKNWTLIVIKVKCLYLTSPIFNSSAKLNRTFYLMGRLY